MHEVNSKGHRRLAGSDQMWRSSKKDDCLVFRNHNFAGPWAQIGAFRKIECTWRKNKLDFVPVIWKKTVLRVSQSVKLRKGYLVSGRAFTEHKLLNTSQHNVHNRCVAIGDMPWRDCVSFARDQKSRNLCRFQMTRKQSVIFVAQRNHIQKVGYSELQLVAHWKYDELFKTHTFGYLENVLVRSKSIQLMGLSTLPLLKLATNCFTVIERFFSVTWNNS